uniref:DUF19 domain-containing protein n=1 Tax=Caenorhabditis tropicalis TaxID=1561998 RepID=A0A1I7UWA6_9PELO
MLSRCILNWSNEFLYSEDERSCSVIKVCKRIFRNSEIFLSLDDQKIVQESPKKWSCSSIESLGNCLLPEVQRYCDPSILPIFKEHQSTRLYYLGCDGRLKFKDYEEGINATSASLLL